MGDLTEENAFFSPVPKWITMLNTQERVWAVLVRNPFEPGPSKRQPFLNDEYLKEIESYDDQRYFFKGCKCYHFFKKNCPPHNVF